MKIFMFWDALTVIFAFGVGAIPFGIIIPRLTGLGDVRKTGSGNMGATNITRIHGIKWGGIVFALDACKGSLAIIVASFVSSSLIPAAAVAVIIGHIFSPFLRFAGGKGVSTMFGVYVVAQPWLGALGLLVWLSAFIASKRSSVGALSAVGVMAFAGAIWRFVYPDNAVYGWVFDVTIPLVIYTAHRDNIHRLANGQEQALSLQQPKMNKDLS